MSGRIERLEDGSYTLPDGRVYDPRDFLPGERGGLLARCQHGRYESLVDNPGGEQCSLPARRGYRVCHRHGGLNVAKAFLDAHMVPLVEELVHIALDRTEKASDRLRAIDSALDRMGGLPRQAVVSTPDARAALLERLAAVEVEVTEEAIHELSAAEDMEEGTEGSK